jgi:cell division protein FtsW (lipid II flippase)
LDELFMKKNLTVFMIFSAFCFGCLAVMGDFGTAIIFYVTFVIIAFLRSGDFSKLVLFLGAALAGGLMILRFKPYIANRFASWGHVWEPEFVDGAGFQQSRAMSAAASGGMVGVGAGEGWLESVPAADTDMVFGMLIEEWGLIIALLAVACMVTLAVFAVRSIMEGRSAFYTIGACGAMSMFVFQTILNVFGSVDLFPFTGVTFPFVSNGGTSMMVSWALLAFLKSADTREHASIAVKAGERL